MYFNNPELKSDMDAGALKMQANVPSVQIGEQHNEIVVTENLYNIYNATARGLNQVYSPSDFSADEDNPLQDAENCEIDDPKQRLIV
jgi:hypothetical protein